MNAIAIVDGRISDICERSLLRRGFYIIKLPPSKNLSTPIASHPDMLIFKHDGELITSAEYCDEAAYVFTDMREFAPSVRITFSAESQSPEYPKDAIFNALVIGNNVFIKTDTASRSVIDYSRMTGLTIHHVNQGYPACTVLPLGDKSAITADEGMALAMEKAGITVTRIRNGGISLPPYEYGFIGGAAGVYGKTVYFLGNPIFHPDGEKIIAAAEGAGFKSVALSDEPLSDLGRILFL